MQLAPDVSAMAQELQKENTASPFFSILSEAESIQVREVVPSTQHTIIASVDDAIKTFEHSDSELETRSFLITVKKPSSPKDTSKPVTIESRNNDEEASILSKARLLLHNQDFLLARNLYSFILKKDIKHPEALKGLGQCLLNLGDTTAARKCFNALIEIHKSVEGLALLGICFIRENKDVNAFETFSKIKDPSNISPDLRFTFYKELGNCLTRLERFNEASNAYNQALSINPRSEVILINLGTLEIQRKRFENATRYFQQAIDFCPSAAKAFCGIGLVAQMCHEDDIADLYLQKTLDIDCQNSVALHQLYALAKNESDWKKLRIRLVQALIKDPAHMDHRFLLAATLLKQNDWSGCESELNIILRKYPEHPKARGLREELSLHRHRQGGSL